MSMNYASNYGTRKGIRDQSIDMSVGRLLFACCTVLHAVMWEACNKAFR